MNKRKNGIFSRPFLIGLIIYIVLFFLIAGVGLAVLWDFLGAYENSRPQTALDNYMEHLTVDHLFGLSQNYMPDFDQNLQNEAACREIIRNQLSDKFTYAKNVSKSTDGQWIYALRCGSKIVGEITLTHEEKSRYGFSDWKVSKETADFSWVKGEKQTITVPSEFSVSVNGILLDETYVTKDNVPYPEMKEFYKDYHLPHLTTYEVGPLLGEVDFEVKDRTGAAVVLGDSADLSEFLNNCTDEERNSLEQFLDTYIKLFVTYGGSNKNNVAANFNKLAQYMVKNGELANRFRSALSNYEYAQNKGNTVASMTINRMVNIGEDRYLCDVTYLVDTNGKNGVVRTTNNVKIIVVKQGGKLLAEAMTGY